MSPRMHRRFDRWLDAKGNSPDGDPWLGWPLGWGLAKWVQVTELALCRVGSGARTLTNNPPNWERWR